MKKVKRIVVWFRQDLRLHDNEALTAALEQAEEVVPVYVFDPRLFVSSTTYRYGFPKTGVFRARFILECVAELRDNLRRLGTDLVVRYGEPETEVFELARNLKSSWVYANRERTWEEEQVQNALEKRLWSIGQELHFFRGKMLYHTQDLPFPVSQTPDIFTQYRKEVERGVPIRSPLPAPQSMAPWSASVAPGDLPTLADLGYAEPPPPHPQAALAFRGGEHQALNRLQYYFWETDLVSGYESTRNGLLGGDYSTKFSPWLAQGCLSPKQIYAELKRYEAQRGANKSTYWLYFELLWRDFCRLMGKKHGSRIFFKNGIVGRTPSKKMSPDRQALERWIRGETGEPFIDANMNELRLTGFLSNRGRQNAASYLINDLHVDWRMGAEYFESQLIDYDVCSNWVNWLYLAGVGNDPRDERYFNPKSQAQRYDPNGEYVRKWLHCKEEQSPHNETYF